MNYKFLAFVQIVLSLHAFASLGAACYFVLHDNWAYWLFMPLAALSAFILLMWGDIFLKP